MSGMLVLAAAPQCAAYAKEVPLLHVYIVHTQVGGLIKRLDTGEGSYAKELEEDYDVADQLDQVLL